MSDPETQAFVTKWFLYAAEDLAAVRATHVSPRIRCFHAQQATEKALKGALTFLAIDAPRRHDLNYLVGLLPSGWEIEASTIDLEWLTRWALDQPYPGDEPEATEVDVQRGLLLASAAVELLRARVVANDAT